jgi:hypothetical protein
MTKEDARGRDGLEGTIRAGKGESDVFPDAERDFKRRFES